MISFLKKLPRKYYAIFAGLVIIAAPSILWLPRYTTSDPDYCLKCHGEKGGLPDRGIASKIHPDIHKVRCVDCHSWPNKLVYEGYVKGFMAETERITPNCIRCHKDIQNRNDVAGFKHNKLKIGIPHKFHMNMGAKCTDCHANIAHDISDNPTNRPKMEYCGQCHATSVEPCTKCHLEKPPPGKYKTSYSAGLVGDGKSLYDKYCSSCHGFNGTGVENCNLRSKELFDKYDIRSLKRKTLDGHKNMPPFDINKGGSLTEDEVRAILAHLKLSSSGSLNNGQVLYEGYCAVCHGAKGNKIPRTDMSNLSYAKTLLYENLVRFLRIGKKGFHAFDKPYGGPLPYEGIISIAKYIPTLSAPVIVADTAGIALNQEGMKLYQANCSECHGSKENVQHQQERTMYVPDVSLFSGKYLKTLGDRKFAKTVAEGIGSMPGFAKGAGGNLTTVDINSILDYLKVKTGLSAGVAAGDETMRGKAPKIPHEVSQDMEDCMECHSSDGIKPFPKDHSGRTVKSCKSCHKASK
ncbi:MAG: C-type cytochrome [Ignavibacteria bacterium]|nr:C-type cytochrome [Ignavibacteria bacterium]